MHSFQEDIVGKMHGPVELELSPVDKLSKRFVLYYFGKFQQRRLCRTFGPFDFGSDLWDMLCRNLGPFGSGIFRLDRPNMHYWRCFQ